MSCRVCGKDLTDPVSVALGIGPICYMERKMKELNSGDSLFADRQEMIDITDSGLIQSLDYNDETNESRPVWYIGSRGDDSAGLPATQYTPFFPSLEELNAFCVRHIDFVGSIPEGVLKEGERIVFPDAPL